jgi:hypothetical protein
MSGNIKFNTRTFVKKTVLGIPQGLVTPQDLKKFGLDKSQISFEELLDKISTELARQALYACQDIAERVGLSTMSLEDINAEIKAVRRQNAEPRS